MTSLPRTESPCNESPAQPSREPAPAAQPAAAIARNAFHLILGQLATMLLSIVLSSALARSLGAADYGNLYVVMSTVWFSYLFVEWGQAQYVVREVARQPAKAGVLLGSTLVFRCAAALLVTGPAVGAAWVFGYSRQIVLLTGAFMVANLAQSCAQACGLVFRGRERMDYDALVTVAMKVLTVVLTLLALYLGGRLPAVILAQGAAGIGALALALALARKVPIPGTRATVDVGRELLIGGAATLALSLANFAQPYIDVVVLSKMAPAITVGWYAAAKNFMNALLMPAAILGSAAYPRLSRAAHDPAQFRRELSTAFRPLLIIGSLVCSGTYLFADLAVGVVFNAAQFGPAITVLQVFAPGLFLLFIDIVLATAILAVGRPRILASAKAGVLVIAAVLDVVLVPFTETRYGNGGIGLVLSFGASETLMLVAALTLVPRGSLERRLLSDLARVVAVAGGVLLSIKLLPAMSPLPRLPVFFVLFAAFSLLLRVVSRDDIALMRSLLSKSPARAPGGDRAR